MNDTELLAQFARDGSAGAFRELVARHTNFVYSCACQRLHDAHAAEDVTQAVFLALALKAKGLSPDTPLPGWLFKATRYACAKHQRGEQRRKEREMHASEKLSASADTSAPWAEIEPHLAAALDALPDKDREAVFARFYRQGSYRDVAAVLRTSEDSARKRVDRALEKLRAIFTKKGLVLSAAGLGGLLTANAVQAAPAGLAVTCVGLTAGSALAGSISTLMLAKGALKAMFIAKVKTVSLAAAACLVVAGTGVVAAKQLSVPVEPQPTTVALSSNPSPSPQAVTLPPIHQEPVSSTDSRPEPVLVVAQSEPSFPPAAPAEYKPVQLTRGVIVGMRNNAGRWSCQVALEKPFNNLNEISVGCCNPPAIIRFDGQPATFEQAVGPGRAIEFDHVRGLTPYISVSSEATKRSLLTWAEILAKADAAAPGMFVDRVPTGGTRDIQVRLDNDLYTVSTINTLTIAGKRQETGRARLTLDAAGNLVGQVETDWKD